MLRITHCHRSEPRSARGDTCLADPRAVAPKLELSAVGQLVVDLWMGLRRDEQANIVCGAR